LRTLQVDALPDSIQQRIVSAIEAFELGARPSVPPQQTQPVSQRASTVDRVLANVEKVLGLQAHAIDRDQPFQEWGLDSILAVRLAGALEKEFGREVTPHWLVEHPTINALTRRLSEQGSETEQAM
jgi:acyl carrier protein